MIKGIKKKAAIRWNVERCGAGVSQRRSNWMKEPRGMRCCSTGVQRHYENLPRCFHFIKLIYFSVKLMELLPLFQ